MLRRSFSRFIVKLGLSLAAAILSVLNVWGEDNVTTGFKMTGFGSYESGELLKWRYKGQDFPTIGLMRNIGSLTGNYIVNEHLRVAAGITGKLYYDTYQQEVLFVAYTPKRQQFTVSLSSAEAVFNYNLRDMGKFLFEIGYFPFKYNPDSRNLGEYLFRCGTYPPTVFTDIDAAFARLTGLHLSCNLFDMVTLQGFLTQENQYPSFYDFSLTGMADVNIKNIFTAGLGIMGCRIVPFDDSVTSRKDDARNRYVDSTLPNNTGYYTFAGTKLMARFSFDPKKLLTSDENWWILGKDDCKLYGEVAMLGLKDYPQYYEHLDKRMPRMIGFNWPTWEFLSYGIVPGVLGLSLQRDMGRKAGSALVSEVSGLLFGAGAWLARKYLNWNLRPDICAFEVEYYPWNYPNNPENQIYMGEAIPGDIPALGQTQYAPDDYNKDNWKWSLYVRKVFYQHFSVLLQFANDHLMLPSYDGKYNQSEEVLGRYNSWYWLLKFGFMF